MFLTLNLLMQLLCGVAVVYNLWKSPLKDTLKLVKNFVTVIIGIIFLISIVAQYEVYDSLGIERNQILALFTAISGAFAWITGKIKSILENDTKSKS